MPLSVTSAFDPGVRKAEGVVALDGHVGGTLTAPLPVVAAQVRDGSLMYTPLGLTLSEFDLHMQATHEGIVLESLSVVSQPTRKLRAGSGLDLEGGSPRIVVTGHAGMVDWEPGAMVAEVAFRDGAWLTANNDASMRLNGDIHIEGEWPKLAVDGDVEVVYGRVMLDTAAFVSSAPLSPAHELTIVRGDSAQRRTAREEPPLYAEFDVNVDVDLQRNVELEVAMPFIDNLGALGAAVTRVDLNARLGGDLDIALRDGEPTLVGEVDLLDGKVGVLRSAFDLKEGTLFFAGGDVTEPNLDVRAEMRITDATLAMDIAGTPSDPSFDLRSEEYPDDTEQMTILLTGRAPEELTSDQGAGTAEAVAGLLFNSVLGSESLGTLSIEPDGTVRMGVPVSNRVYATTRLRPHHRPNPELTGGAARVERAAAAGPGHRGG